MTSKDFCYVNECVYAKKLRYCPTVFQEILQKLCYVWEDMANLAEIFERS